MSRPINIDTLRLHLEHAKARLSLEKSEILGLSPLPKDFNREEYAFAYLRAERTGMRVINHRLADISWLPMQLDPSSEILADGRSSMKRWLTSSIIHTPNSEEFGNDFIHTLTRVGMQNGWDTPIFAKLGIRVANLFRDLSCLIGIVYYCSWLSEHGVEELHLSNPDNLSNTAEEIAMLLQSPEIYRQLKAQEQNDDKKSNRKSSRQNSATGRIIKPKVRPTLHVIDNSFTPEPSPVV